jgi:hypothetical protein
MTRKRKAQPKFQYATALDGAVIILDPIGTSENPYSSRTQDQPWYIQIERIAEQAITEYYGDHD